MQKGNQRVLIIAPHPDDEINLAGQFLITLHKWQYEIYVLYTTNGDAEKKIGNERIYEALNANSILGIDRDHIIFLGYPNEWEGKVHIYNAAPEKVLNSKLGKTLTNSIPEHPEYCYLRERRHHPFTRNNFKNDYKKAIQELMPEIIICPEFDSHPDHRAAALMFDEIMGEILKENCGYKPVVLKKYIHEGVWQGPKDYYERPAHDTLTDGPRCYCGGLHDLDSPNFRWMERISIPADESTLTELLRDNIVYRAAKAHKATTAWYEMQRVINGDIVYWNRPTNNLVLEAHIKTSSGVGAYVNDFKHFDSSDVNEQEDPFCMPQCFCWQPSMLDSQKELRICFEENKGIRVIRLYEDCNIENHIKKIRITINNISVFEGELNTDGSKTDIVLDSVIQADEVIIKILDWIGIPGISEVEIYSEIDKTLPFENLLLDENNKEYMGKTGITMLQKLEKIYLIMKFIRTFKLKYEIKRILRIS